MSHRRWFFSVTTVVLSLLPIASARAFMVEGTVTTADGAALPGARAEVRPLASNYETTRRFLAGEAEPNPLATALTGDGGRFAVEVKESGLYSLTVGARGFVSMTFLPLPVTGSRELPAVALAADSPAIVEVRESGGEPVSGAWILARPSRGYAGVLAADGGWRPAHRLRRTNAGGTVDVPRAAGERLDLSLFLPGRCGMRERHEVETAAVFEIAPETASTAPRVVEVRRPGGEPVAGAVVALGDRIWPAGTVDEHGRLALPGSLAVPVGVHVLGPRGELRSAVVDGDRAVVTLAPPLAVRGTVLRQADRRPIGAALVWSLDDPGAFTKSDERGRYAVWAVERVRAEATGYLPATAVGRSGRDLPLLLLPSRAAVGRVVDLERHPIAGAVVRLAPSTDDGTRLDPDLFTATTGADGRFEVFLPAARVDVAARRPGYAPTVVRGVQTGRAKASQPVDLGTLILGPGASIHGRASDEEGRGLADVAVWLSDDLERSAAELAASPPGRAPDAVTDAGGRFAVDDLPAGARFHLAFRAEGRLPASLEAVPAPPRGSLEVVLESGGRLRGRVIDEARVGVAGAEVSLWPAAPRPGQLEMPLLGKGHQKTVATDDDGSFAIDAVQAGSYEIAATAEGYVPGESRTVAVEAGREQDGLELALRTGATLSGRVTTSSGDAVEGARVRVEGGGTATSGSDGVYRVRGVPEGRRSVRARHPVYRAVDREVEIIAGDNALDFVFEPGQAVAGRVVDGEGGPVAGATLELRQLDPEDPHLLRAESDEDGLFRLEAAAGRYRLSAEKAGHGWIELARDVVVGDRPVEDLEIVLPAGTTLTGRVLGLDFDEIASVRVTAEHDGRPPRQGQVDYEGAYRIDDLLPGDWRVRASVDGGRRQARARVVVEPGTRRLERDLELDAGFVLAGQVLFAGEPLAGARVTVRGEEMAVPRTILSDLEGTFRVEGLKRGDYEVGVSHAREIAIQNTDVTLDGDRWISIEIEPARVYGRVTAKDGGRPLEGARVTLRQLLDSGREGSVFSVPTGADGAFAVPRITAGRYRATVARDGYEPLADALEIQAGIDLGPLEYELAATPGLELRVRLATGETPPYVTVSLAGEDGAPRLVEGRPVDAGGLVEFPTVPAGSWTLLVSAPEAAAQEVAVTVPGEAVDVVLAPASRLRVRVPTLVESERRATVRLVAADGQPFRGVSDAGDLGDAWRMTAGVAEIPGVPAGRWTVEVVSADGQAWASAVTTAAEPEVAVNLP